jgi:hypothetical protein
MQGAETIWGPSQTLSGNPRRWDGWVKNYPRVEGENMQYGRMRSMLSAEAMLVGVEESMGVPNALDPSGNYTSPHLLDYLKQ